MPAMIINSFNKSFLLWYKSITVLITEFELYYIVISLHKLKPRALLFTEKYVQWKNSYV